MKNESLANVAFTIEDLAAIATALTTLQQLYLKIKNSAPDAWTSTQADFSVAIQNWQHAIAGTIIDSGEAAKVVNASGVTDTTPRELTDVAEIPPTSIRQVNEIKPNTGADALSVGYHVQAPPAL